MHVATCNNIENFVNSMTRYFESRGINLRKFPFRIIDRYTMKFVFTNK